MKISKLLYIGDWVEVRNPNDETKPIPAQIYKIYDTEK